VHKLDRHRLFSLATLTFDLLGPVSHKVHQGASLLRSVSSNAHRSIGSGQVLHDCAVGRDKRHHHDNHDAQLQQTAHRRFTALHSEVLYSLKQYRLYTGPSYMASFR